MCCYYCEILSTCIFLSGYFTLPVTCLVESQPNRLLRPVDPVFVDTLKSHMKSNPSRDVTPIVGLVWLPDGEEFQEDRKNTYLYKTLGGNNSRVAMQELLDEDDLRFRTRLVSVYCHLTDNQALRLASKHNLATSVHHEMSTSDKVSDIKFITIELRFTATDYRHTL